MHEQDEYITLGKAAQLAPGRPSSNSVWRWCRKGVKSRSGKRVHLRHVRLGRKVFTTKAWLAEFGRELAEADAEHFAVCEEIPRFRIARGPGRSDARRQAAIEQAQRELEEAGA
jgi:hypothetical protein